MELVIIEKRKSASKPMTSVTYAKESVGFSPQTPLVKSNNAIVKSANVLVPTMKTNTIKSTKLFLTAPEKNINEESNQIEIILQIPKMMIQKRGNYQIEMELNNDVFTVLEHPMKKMAKTETNFKKESLYVGHVRAGLVKRIEVTLPETGNV
jgi:CRISPR/Cas system CSM-associated protein Csm2 small subunit